jgi:hypothetical protein
MILLQSGDGYIKFNELKSLNNRIIRSEDKLMMIIYQFYLLFIDFISFN